jgi:hypothetical protein
MGDILTVLGLGREMLKRDYEQKCDSFKNMTDAQIYGSQYPANAITMLTMMAETRTRLAELSDIISIIENMEKETT